MRFLLIGVCFLCLTATGLVWADGAGLVLGGGPGFSEQFGGGSHEPMVNGSVFINHTGSVKVIWDSVTANGGTYSITMTDTPLNDSQRAYFAVNLPSLQFDLQKMFGVDWMQGIKLSFNTLVYDESPFRNTTDVFVGRITLGLTQNVIKGKSFRWEVSEAAGLVPYQSRFYYVGKNTAQSVQAHFALNNKLVVNISQNFVAMVTVGAYAVIFDKLNGPDEDRVGGFIAPQVDLFKSLSIGARAEYTERILFKKPSTTFTKTVQASGFVKYAFPKQPGSLVQHAVQVNFGWMYDETVPMRADGAANDRLVTSAQYLVMF